MIKNFDITANAVLSSAVDSIVTSLQCSRYNQVANRIIISLPEGVTFEVRENKEMANKGFGTCLIKSYNFHIWEVTIVVNMKNCFQANLTEREIGAVILHELGHILNEPELQAEPTFNYCYIHGIQYSKELLENVRESNCIASETFADSYANQHGYGQELISTFHKQNQTFDQKIGNCTIRIEKLQNNVYFEGKVMSFHEKSR